MDIETLFWCVIAPILLFILLIVVPIYYCVKTPGFLRGLFFTWITWSLVLFFYTLLAFIYIVVIEKATGIEKGGKDHLVNMYFSGVVIGWLPGLFFSFLCYLGHNLFIEDKTSECPRVSQGLETKK